MGTAGIYQYDWNAYEWTRIQEFVPTVSSVSGTYHNGDRWIAFYSDGTCRYSLSGQLLNGYWTLSVSGYTITVTGITYLSTFRIDQNNENYLYSPTGAGGIEYTWKRN